MKLSFRFLLGLMVIPLLLGAAGAVQADLIPVSFSNQVGVGCQSAAQSTFGDYKSCGTDAFFYILLVNESDKNVNVTLPTRVYVNHTYLPVDADGWYYKPVLNGWTWQNYADAKSGEALPADTYGVFTLPAHTVYSVMGHMLKLPYTYTLARDIQTRTDSSDHFEFQLDVIFNTETLPLTGSFVSEGSVCESAEPVSFNAGQNLRAGYLISTQAQPTCSMAYYFPVRNNDSRYSTIVLLPQVIEMDDVTWQIGCPTTYEDAQCTISGFRHYAWAPLNESAPDTLVDSSFHFCDQDKRFGDACYENGDDWVVEIPPHTTYIIRGMVNDLCSGTENKKNPLESPYIDVSLWIRTNALWDYEVTDMITGTARVDSLSDISTLSSVSNFISRVEDADPTRASYQVNWEDAGEIGADSMMMGMSAPETSVSSVEEDTTLRLFRF